MREILFRGKRKDNGEWVYSNGYATVNTVAFLLNARKPILKVYEKTIDNKTDVVFNFEIVKPETVGQFTGLTDKNGKKIFEGDILKYCQQDGAKLNDKPVFCVGKIVWNAKTLSFAIDSVDDIGGKNYDYFPLKKEIEVIGNIYDNPELLGD